MSGAGTDDRAVAVTGLGIVSVLGESVADFRQALMSGRSGITRWRAMDERIYSKIGGDMSAFDASQHLARVGSSYPKALTQAALKLLRATPLSGRMTACAALQAFVDSGGDFVPERCAHVLAGHNVTSNYIVENVKVHVGEPEFIDALFGFMALDTDVLSVVSELLTLKGPSFTVGGACASGNLGILTGLDILRSGRADVVVVSGGSADLDPVTLQGWAMIDALTIRSYNERPELASRPFDSKREGFVPSEGAAAVVLETMQHARKRGAKIHATILGASSASDASRLTKPNRDGQVRAMKAALLDAGVDRDRVDYVNAHATSTQLGDQVETEAIKEVLGARAYKIPVNSTKSMVGHCLTAAGVVELVATILEIEGKFVHPTINQEEKDPALDLDYVPNVSRDHKIEIAVSNSFGFGGINSCVVVGRAP
jgi:3-oxoacyl-(acyl-carrier-protein) synthase